MESWRARVPVDALGTSFLRQKHQDRGEYIDLVHCFSAVGSALPGRAAASKGGGVHSSKSHVNWVKYGASQYGLYLLEVWIT